MRLKNVEHQLIRAPLVSKINLHRPCSEVWHQPCETQLIVSLGSQTWQILASSSVIENFLLAFQNL